MQKILNVVGKAPWDYLAGVASAFFGVLALTGDGFTDWFLEPFFWFAISVVAVSGSLLVTWRGRRQRRRDLSSRDPEDVVAALNELDPNANVWVVKKQQDRES